MRIQWKSIGKMFFRKLCAFLLFVLLGFIISLVLGFLVGGFFYLIRDKELIAAICHNPRDSYTGYHFFNYINDFFFLVWFFGFVIAAFLLRKSLFRGMGFVFLPFEIAVFCFTLVMAFATTMIEKQCIYNPLIDTCHSESFNPYNVPKVEIGMSREEVVRLIGEPLREMGSHAFFTGDGACTFGDYAWYDL